MAKFEKSTRNMVDIDEELNKLESKKKAAKKETIKKTAKDKPKKQATKKVVAKEKKGKDNFFREVKKEVSKVQWPSRKDMVKYSFATILFIFFFAGFFYLIELILALLKMGV